MEILSLWYDCTLESEQFMKINYKIEAIDILLNRECILEKYYCLIIKKKELIDYLLSIKCYTKNECLLLSDEELLNSNLLELNEINLLRRFFVMYDVNDVKFKEIEKEKLSEEEKESYKALYLLPGVKKTRAGLYFNSGFKSLDDIAKSSADEVIVCTKSFIDDRKLDIKPPLMKEVKTHIAVSKVFTQYVIY